jgi:hypothetical protein
MAHDHFPTNQIEVKDRKNEASATPRNCSRITAASADQPIRRS